MKTASIVGAILPQTPVHLAQILNSIFQWGDFNPGTFTLKPKFFEDIQLDDERSKPIQQRLGLTRIYVFCCENISVVNYAFLG